MIGDRESILGRWSSYFKGLLNPSGVGEGQVVPARQFVIEDEVIDEEEPPELEEVMEVISALKNNKAAGEDGIPSELLKYAGEELIKELHSLVWDIWMGEKMPEGWNTSIICPIYKKGDKLECHSYRGISLLNTAYKVFSTLL